MATDSLRTRLLAGQLLLLVVLAAGFGLMVYQFVEVLERELLHTRVADQLDAFAAAYRENPSVSPPVAAYLQGYAVRPGQEAGTPAWLLSLGPGLHQEVSAEGRYFDVARTDVDGARLYVVLDVEPVERLESMLVAIAATTLLAAMGIGALLAWRLSDYVLRPLTELAAQLVTLDPRQRSFRMSPGGGDAEVRRIAEAFNRYLERLDDFVEREQAFSADVSHELRTPLAIILSSVQLLRDDVSLSPAARARTQRIGRAAANMHELIEAMLFLAREDGGAPPGICPLDQVVQEVVANHRARALERGIQLHLTMTGAQTIPAPAGMVGCVIGNLVGNAVAHAGHGVIDIKLEPGVLTVADYGNGIPPEDLRRVFDRGYRSPGSQGAGIGLALVKRICDRLGWVAGIESRPGQGTRIELRFAGAAMRYG